MQIHPFPSRYRPAGYALIIVMISLALLLAAFASTLYWATSNASVTVRNNLFNVSQNAAESATENIMSYMMRDFTDGNLGSAASYNLFPPTNGWPIVFQFSDTNGNTANAATVNIGTAAASALNSQYTGLYGFTIPVVIASTATPQNQGGSHISATVYQSMQFALIPLFQFAIFYNLDMEINPGAAMTVNGHVHSNDNIWATGSGSGSSALVFANEVDAAQNATNLPSPLDPQNRSRSGNVVYNDSGSPLSDYTSLNLPIGGTTNNNPTNVLAILNPPPLTNAPPNFGNAYSTNGMVYLMNAADLIISNAYNGTNGTLGTNIIVYYQNPNAAPGYITQVPGDTLVVSNVTGSGASKATNMIYDYSFVTNISFYDYRESDVAQAVTIDVGKLDTWLNNTNSRGGAQYNQMNSGTSSTSKGHQINSIYVYNNVPPTTSQLPAVRLTDGQELPPGGLTVATPMPLYVEGNYNTTTNGTQFSTALGNTQNTVPAALLGDSITLLSSQWKDTNGAALAVSARNAANITINAATLEGIVPSNGNNYSGGVENFLRLLENWSGDTITYNGSIVVMFPSQYATNFWQAPGTTSPAYYEAPTRNWGFDTNFLSSSRLPPLTPTVKAIIRGNWASW